MLLLVGGTLALLFLDLPWSVLVIVLLAGVELLEVRLWMWARRARPRAGAQGMVGERGKLVTPDRVRIRGTSYRARVLEGDAGDVVEVAQVEGMTLIVRRVGRS